MGSYARGDANETSDLEFFVVKLVVTSRRQEILRLTNVLWPLRIPVDVLVASNPVFAKWREISGTVLYRADKKGKVLYAVQ